MRLEAKARDAGVDVEVWETVAAFLDRWTSSGNRNEGAPVWWSQD